MVEGTEPQGNDSDSYEALLESVAEELSELGRTVLEAEGMGLGPLSFDEARSEVEAVGNGLAEQCGLVIGSSQLILSERRQLAEETLVQVVESLNEIVMRLRRLVAPLNLHHLDHLSLAAMPFVLENLPPALLVLSRVSGLDPQLSGRLFILSGELEFLGVLLSTATEQEDAPESEVEASPITLARLRTELDALATAGTSTDVALVRKRLNDTLDEIENQDTAAEEVLARIAEANEQIEAHRANLDRLVGVAREAGVSWNKIAKAVGVSAQSAHKRWDPEARAKARKYMQEYSAKRRDE